MIDIFQNKDKVNFVAKFDKCSLVIYNERRFIKYYTIKNLRQIKLKGLKCQK